MPFDQRLPSATETFPAFLSANTIEVEAAVAAFEDRLWFAAETIIAAGAPSLSAVAQAASLVRLHGDLFASILSGAIHMKSLGDHASPVCGHALDDDIAASADRLIRRLKQDLSELEN